MIEENRDIAKLLLKKKIIVTKKINGKDFFFRGPLKSVTDSGVWIDDQEDGLMFFNFNDISSMKEAGNQ